MLRDTKPGGIERILLRQTEEERVTHEACRVPHEEYGAMDEEGREAGEVIVGTRDAVCQLRGGSETPGTSCGEYAKRISHRVQAAFLTAVFIRPDTARR